MNPIGILPMFMNDSIEGKTIPPGGGEVSHVHVVVTSSFHLAPATRQSINQFILFGFFEFSSDWALITKPKHDLDEEN